MHDVISDVVSTDFGVDGLSGVMCHFEKDVFKDGDFSSYKIYQPINISQAVPKRQAEFLAGRHCAALALKALGSYDSFTVEIGESREPIWPKGVVGSITHSANKAAAVVGRAQKFGGIGLDIENVIDDHVYQQISKRVLNDSERNLLRSVVHEELLAFTFIFGVKEAFFKAVFQQVGIYLGFNTITVTSLPKGEAGTVNFQLNRDLGLGLEREKRFKAEVETFENTQVRALVVLGKST